MVDVVVDEVVVDEVVVVVVVGVEDCLTRIYPLAPIPITIKSNKTMIKDEIPFNIN